MPGGLPDLGIRKTKDWQKPATRLQVFYLAAHTTWLYLRLHLTAPTVPQPLYQTGSGKTGEGNQELNTSLREGRVIFRVPTHSKEGTKGWRRDRWTHPLEGSSSLSFQLCRHLLMGELPTQTYRRQNSFKVVFLFSWHMASALYVASWNCLWHCPLRHRFTLCSPQRPCQAGAHHGAMTNLGFFFPLIH